MDSSSRPSWMSKEEYKQQPATLELRLIDVNVNRKGFRPSQFTVTTTMTDDEQYSGNWIRSIFESRWLVELAIRAIKCSLNIDILRAKTPVMVRTELWSCLLAYNLIRVKMLQSCAVSDRDPRSVSFTTTMQLLATNWLLCAVVGVTSELATLAQSVPIGQRDGRTEPQVNKRRPKVLALMQKPSHELRHELNAAA